MVANRDGFGIPLVTAINPEKEAVALIKSDKLDDFVTMLNFIDTDMAISFAQCVHKCRQYGLKKKEEFFFLVARALVSVKDKKGTNRAGMFSMTLMGVAVPDAYGGGKENKHGNRDKDRQNP